jgi:energy-coupling factor transporter ATP-binding protein EcfA2
VNKVDSIKLPKTSPLGAQTIGGGDTPLSEFDLVVITGPNGSGKTTLATALADVPHGVQVVGPDGSSITLGDGSDVAKSLLTRSGSELMGPFQSLKAALAAGSGVAAIRDDKQLLELLVAKRANAPFRIARFLPTAANAQDAELRRRIDDYLAVEQRAIKALESDRPLTRATFNEIGSEVALRLGLTWAAPAVVSDEAMRAAEEAVRPAAKVIVGEAQLLQAIATAIASLDAARAQQLIDQITTAEKNRAAEIQKAMALAPLAPDEAAPAPEQWPARCERFAAADETQITALKAERHALDMLGTIRQQAEEWISQHQSDHCPVCSQQVDRDRLVAELRAAAGTSERVAEIDRTTRELAARAVSFRRASEEITRRIDAVTQAQRGAGVQLAQWRQAVDAIEAACAAATNWDAEVVAVAGRIREACAACLGNPHWSGNGVDAVAGAGAIVGDLLATISAERRTRAEAAENARRNLAPAESAFRQLSPLRELLVAREALNTVSWEPRWESAITDELKRKVIKRWQDAVNELIAELDGQEEHAQRTILDNEQVMHRFRTLCTAARHPLIAQAQFDADSVTANGEQIDTKGSRTKAGVRLPELSEGFRVIVNLAAFIAVSGHVCVGQQHQAGWIVLDEPTNALDGRNRQEVAKYLGGLSTDLMPRQMFITTFEEEFVKELLAAAKMSGRKALCIELPEWTGNTPVTPTLKRV